MKFIIRDEILRFIGKSEPRSKEEAELLAMLNDLSPKSRKKFAALLKQMINTLK